MVQVVLLGVGWKADRSRRGGSTDARAGLAAADRRDLASAVSNTWPVIVEVIDAPSTDWTIGRTPFCEPASEPSGLKRRERNLAQQIRDRLLMLQTLRYVPPTSLAAVHVALGETARALDALARAFEARDPRIVDMKDDQRWTAAKAGTPA